MNPPDHSQSFPKYTFCVGMRRGGSTLQTQLVAAILGRVPMRLVTPESLESFLQETASEPGPIVVKCHRFLPQAVELLQQGDAKIVYTFRDVRDVVASISKKYDIPQFAFVHGGLTSLLEEYQQWIDVPKIHIAKYETMIGSIADEVKRLAEYLNVVLSEADAKSLADEFSVDNAKEKIEKSLTENTIAGVGENVYDKGSLLHPNHIQTGGSGGYLELLTPDVIAALEWEAQSWLRKHGYPVNYSRLRQITARVGFDVKSILHRCREIVVRSSERTSS